MAQFKPIRNKNRKAPVKPRILKGKAIPMNAAIQIRYVSDVNKLMELVIKKTEQAIKQIYKSPTSKEYFTMDASMTSQAKARMNKLFREISKLVSGKADTMVERMLITTNKASKNSLNQSLKELSKGLLIQPDFKNTAGMTEVLKSSFNSNIDLIKTMSGDYLTSVRGAVYRSITEGGGLETLIPNIQKFLDDKNAQVLNKAKNVALDQTRKAYTAITKTRMTEVGVEKFEWVHSGGGREPREYHKSRAKYPAGLNGQIFSINDPPIIDKKTGERGLPSQAINCKCFMRPIIEFGEVAA